MSESVDHDPFLQEVLGLFAQEAQEWITRSQAALAELEQQPPEPRRQELLDALSAAMTNLGGSAATVELSRLEQVAFALLPLLEAMRAWPGRIHDRHIEVAQAALTTIVAAVTAVACQVQRPEGQTALDWAGGVDELLTAILGAAALAPSTDTAEPPAIASDAPGPALMDRLLELQRLQSMEQGRRTVDSLLRRLQPEGGIEALDPGVVRRALNDLDGLDARLLDTMGERLPLLLTQAEALMDAVQRAPGSEPSLAVLGEVDALLEAARTADATRLIRFFHGLHSFITLLSAGLIAIPPPRVAAVIGKVRELPSVAEEWVQIGRTQRAALLDVLPR